MNHRMVKRIGTLMIACALLLTLWAQGLAETMTVYTARDNAKVYDATGTLIGALPYETALTLTGMKGQVCRVEKSGKVGYMKKGDLKQALSEPAEAEEAPAEIRTATAYVSKDGAKVYNAKGKAAGSLGLNSQVTVTAVKGEYCRITVGGRTGYMKLSDLSADRTEQAEEKEQEKAEENAVVEIKATPGYVNVKTAKVYDATGKEIGTLSLNTAVSVTAYNDNLVQIATGTTKGYMKKSELSDTAIETTNSGYTNGGNKSNGPVGGSTVAPAKGTAQTMDWWTSDIQKIFARGTVVQITDVETGLSWKEKRFGGINHADCQPLTAADTAALKNAYGGKWSWDRRAVFVTIDGVNYAASINGMPHGGQSITDNDFEGHHCIHFTNSRCHFNNKVDSKHQAAIKKAAATTLE